MTIANFIADGLTLDYTPAAAVDAGDIIVIGDEIGVAKLDIAASALGAIALTGIYDVIKDGTTGPVFAAGDPVFFDQATELAVRVETTPPNAGFVYLGIAVNAAGTDEALVRVRIDNTSVPDWMRDLVWEDVTIASGSKTLDANDIGKVMNVIVGHATNVVTLPAVAVGNEYVVRCGLSGERIALSPNASDKLLGADLAGADNTDYILAAATSKAGDYIRVKYFSADGWRIIQRRGIWVSA
jgi:predicted RecA/RadA family phage recombinase